MHSYICILCWNIPWGFMCHSAPRWLLKTGMTRSYNVQDPTSVAEAQTCRQGFSSAALRSRKQWNIHGLCAERSISQWDPPDGRDQVPESLYHRPTLLTAFTPLLPLTASFWLLLAAHQLLIALVPDSSHLSPFGFPIHAAFIKSSASPLNLHLLTAALFASFFALLLPARPHSRSTITFPPSHQPRKALLCAQLPSVQREPTERARDEGEQSK